LPRTFFFKIENPITGVVGQEIQDDLSAYSLLSIWRDFWLPLLRLIQIPIKYKYCLGYLMDRDINYNLNKFITLFIGMKMNGTST
jgi:hypothetical protein